MKKNKKYNEQINKREGLIKLIFYTISIILTIIYIIYRIFYTLPTKLGWLNLTFGILLLIFEIIEAIDFIIYYYNVLCFNKKSPDIPKMDIKNCPAVDVFIPTLNEDKQLLKGTIEACLKMKYPSKDKVHIYLLDDGNRTEIKDLANKYQINYITRTDNKGAKAGNFNNALKQTSSPYIVTFDADMQPTPYFLLKTIPFFEHEKKLGFVQLPQSFTNPDIFQLRFGLTDKIPFEQDYFYHRIQLAKNKTNSTIYCGTNAVLSREALNDIGGFALDTITEDIATGMLIEAKGYKGLALNNVEAYGNAVNDLAAFAKQRSRWGRGCIQVLKNYKIARNKGLSLRQKLDYLASIMYWFFGVKRVIYLIIPLLFSLFGIRIIDCNLMLFMGIFFPQYLIKRIALDVLEDNRRSSTWNKIYELILAPIMFTEVLKELFGFSNKKFEVTPKEKWSTKMTNTNRKILSFHLVFLLFNILGLGLSIYKITILGLETYLLSLVWLLINIFYLIIVLIFDLRVRPIYYESFTPNKVKRYSIKSIIGIFTSIFKKKFKKE